MHPLRISRSMERLGDIPHWRKKIQPARSKTPSLPEGAEEAQDEMHHLDILTARKKPQRPRLTTRLSSILPNGPRPESAYFAAECWGATPFEQPPKVDTLDIVEHLMNRLMQAPGKDLPANETSALLQLLEDFRNVHERNRILEEELQSIQSAFQDAENKWEAEESGYRAEIKRLELLIARGTRGMSGLMKARQGTIIDKKKPHHRTSQAKHHSKVSLSEFLEEDKREQELLRAGQRVVLRPRPGSPSQRMTAMSKILAMTSVHSELPFGILPPENSNFVAFSDSTSSPPLQQISSRVSGSVSSYFSSEGDPLPDEVDDIDSPRSLLQTACDNPELTALALDHARKRGVDIDAFLPKLMNLLCSEETSVSECKKTQEAPSLGGNPHGDGGNENAKLAAEPVDSPVDSKFMTTEWQAPVLRSARPRPFSFDPGDDSRGLGHLSSVEESPLSKATKLEKENTVSYGSRLQKTTGCSIVDSLGCSG